MKNQKEVLEWLEYAESDMELAKKGKVSRKIKFETLCFHAQQAAEKTIKAVLIFNHIDFPKTHEIEVLLKILTKNDVNIPKPVAESKYLTKYAVTKRYPGEEMEVNKKEYNEAVKVASLVLKWAKLITQQKPKDKLF